MDISQTTIQSEITKKYYTIKKNIGSGTYAQCYSATNSDNKEVCLKMVDYFLMDDAQKKSAEREAQVHAVLLNNSIIRFEEAFFYQNESEQNILVIVMELGDSSLDSYLAQNPNYFTPQQLLSFFTNICESLEYMHRRKIIHRDLSSKNLLVFSPNQILNLKLCDFGVSAALNNYELAKTQIGTPHTMAPEIFDGRGYGEKADIWAAGCVFYELFCRQSLFIGLNQLALIKCLEEFKEPHFPQGLDIIYGDQFSQFMMELIKGMLKPDPAQRPNAREVRKEIVSMKNEMEKENVAFSDPVIFLPDAPVVQEKLERTVDLQKVELPKKRTDWGEIARNARETKMGVSGPVLQIDKGMDTPNVRSEYEVVDNGVMYIDMKQPPKKKEREAAKQANKQLSIQEIRKMAKGKSGRDFNVEIVTGLSAEVEAQLNDGKK